MVLRLIFLQIPVFSWTKFCVILQYFLNTAGGFYQENTPTGYSQHQCNRCPNGSFVSEDTAPGKRLSDCKPCPPGLFNVKLLKGATSRHLVAIIV